MSAEDMKGQQNFEEKVHLACFSVSLQYHFLVCYRVKIKCVEYCDFFALSLVCGIALGLGSL
jgi:hypothetical protein